MKQKIVWIVPALLVLLGIGLLFVRNFEDVTEPPDSDWSRPLKLGETVTSDSPAVSSATNGAKIAYLTEEGVKQTGYDQEYSSTEETNIDIPVDKFTSIATPGNQLVYSDYHQLFTEKKEKISDLDTFLPLQNEVIFTKGTDVYVYEEDGSLTSILTLPDEKVEVLTYENHDGTYLATRITESSGNHLTFYHLKDGTLEKVREADIPLQSGEELKEMHFAAAENDIRLIQSTLQKQSMTGKKKQLHYYAAFPAEEEASAPKMSRVTFSDPVTGKSLEELSDIELTVRGDKSLLLFKALGKTDTMFNKETQFNIYQAQVKEKGVNRVTRISNTPSPSLTPQWIDSHSIIWLDKKGDHYQVLLASDEKAVISKTDGISSGNLLQAGGKTAGMLSFGMLIVPISLVWIIWPLVFLTILMFTKTKAMDEDRAWVFYTGAVIYLAAVFLFKGPVFSEQLLARTPDYLNFSGSTFIYLLAFALIAYVLVRAFHRVKDWSPFIQLSYFIGVHVAFITVFFGPYLL